MARFVYGGGGGAQVMSTSGGVLTASATVYSAETGGSVVSDIQNLQGAALAGVVTPDSRGQVAFLGPDAMVSTLWLDFADGGPRWGVVPMDMESAIATKRTALELAEYNTPSGTTPISGIPYVSNSISQKLAQQIDKLLIPRVADSTTRNSLYPSPVEGDRVFNNTIGYQQVYNTVLQGGSRWVNEVSLIREIIFPSSAYNNVSFTGLPNNSTALLITWFGRAVGSTAQYAAFNPVVVQFNGDVNSNYGYIGQAQRIKWASNVPTAQVAEDGTGGAAGTAGAMPTTAATYATINNLFSSGSTNAMVGYVPGSSAQTSQFGGGELWVPGYSSTSGHKSYTASSGFANNAGAAGTAYSGRCAISGGYASTSAVGSVLVALSGAGTWAAGSVIQIYALG